MFWKILIYAFRETCFLIHSDSRKGLETNGTCTSLGFLPWAKLCLMGLVVKGFVFINVGMDQLEFLYQ